MLLPQKLLSPANTPFACFLGCIHPVFILFLNAFREMSLGIWSMYLFYGIGSFILISFLDGWRIPSNAKIVRYRIGSHVRS